MNIVITGGGSGIGKAIAYRLSNNHKVIICGRKESKLKETKLLSSNISYLVCDVSDEDSVKSFQKFVKSSFKTVDVLINNAGIIGSIGKIDETDSALWLETLKVNLFGVYLMTKHFIPIMEKSKVKKLINVSGGGAFGDFPNFTSYSVSKAGVVRFTENTALELKDRGYGVNCLAPGFVDTEIHNDVLNAGLEKVGNYYNEVKSKLVEGSVPLDTVLGCIEFLIKSSNNFTGRTISASFDDWSIDNFENEVNKHDDLFRLRRINLDNLPK